MGARAAFAWLPRARCTAVDSSPPRISKLVSTAAVPPISPSLPRSRAPLSPPPISQSPFLPPSLPPPSPGALVLTVPRECMLMAGEGADDEEAAAAEALHEGCRLSLRLLDERALGDASPLHGWISSLPPRVETPVHWQDAQLRRLGCPLLIAQVSGLGVGLGLVTHSA